MGRVVAIASYKGGSGRTTTAINLGAYLAARGRKTLVVDLDPQANATLGLGIEMAPDALSMLNVLMGDVPIGEVIRKTDIFGLEAAPAALNLAVAEDRNSPLPEHEFSLMKALYPIKEDYHYILLDAPPARGMLATNALIAAEKLVIPVQCEYYAFTAVAQLLETLKRHEERFQKLPEITGALLTMYERWQKLSQAMQSALLKSFPGYVFQAVIPRSVALAEAPRYGKSVLKHAPGSPGALAYRQFTDEFLRREEGGAPKDSSLKKIRAWAKRMPVIMKLFPAS
jgi:chromosome partitioning protein